MVLVGSGPEMSVECRLVWIWGHGHCQAGDNETSKQERVNPRHHPGYLYTVRISPGPNAKQTPQLRASQGLGNANRCCPELPGNFSAVEIGHRLIPGVFSSLAFHQSTEVYIYLSLRYVPCQSSQCCKISSHTYSFMRHFLILTPALENVSEVCGCYCFSWWVKDPLQ